MLDGLRYAKSDDGPSLVATTRGLLDRWLRSRAAETNANFKLPTGIDEALKLDAFYTQAINSDAAFMGTLDFPLKKPEGADIAIARLGGWTQDVGPIYEQQVIRRVAFSLVASIITPTCLASIFVVGSPRSASRRTTQLGISRVGTLLAAAPMRWRSTFATSAIHRL